MRQQALIRGQRAQRMITLTETHRLDVMVFRLSGKSLALALLWSTLIANCWPRRLSCCVGGDGEGGHLSEGQDGERERG